MDTPWMVSSTKYLRTQYDTYLLGIVFFCCFVKIYLL
jgi:hypothetical protein